MASTYLSRTPASAGSTQTGTFSAWVKKSSNATTNRLFSGFINSADFTNIFFRSVNDELTISSQGSASIDIKSAMDFRDNNGFYHIVVAFDLSNGTASNRVKVYVNGNQLTDFDSSTYPSSSDTINFNKTSATAMIGHQEGTYFNGIMSHIHWIDGTVYDASAFGETDATTGIWKPKTAPSVTYGTNGFFLKFENSGAFGTDSSGNGNNFTVNGTMTQTIDTPSNVFATLNPLVGLGSLTLSNGNLTCGNTTTAWDTISSTIGASSGKWYSEYKWDSTSGGFIMNGIISIDTTIDNINSDFYIGQFSTGYGYYSDNGSSYNNGSASAYGNSYTVGDIIGIAMDLDNSKLYFSKNGTWQNSGDPTSGATGTGAISITSGLTYAFGASNRNSAVQSINYGNGYFGTTAVSSAENPDDGIGIFEYDVPTGYRALCTKSINAEEYD